MSVFTKVEGKYLHVGDVVPEHVVGAATGYMNFIWTKDEPIITTPVTVEDVYVQADSISAYSPDGMALYDTFRRDSHLVPWKYMGRCSEGQSVNEDMRIAPYIYVCSPWRAEDMDTALFNSRLAMAACRSQVIERGSMPVAPHLYFPMFLCDEEETERRAGMIVAHRLLAACRGIVAYVVDDLISDGMREELELAASIGMKPVMIRMTREQAEEFIDRMLR